MLTEMPSTPGSCSVDGVTGAAACDLLSSLNAFAAPTTYALAASPRACTVTSCTDANYNEQCRSTSALPLPAIARVCGVSDQVRLLLVMTDMIERFFCDIFLQTACDDRHDRL